MSDPASKPEPPKHVRISPATNERLAGHLKSSRLSKDQFVDYLVTEALDQVEAEEVSYEPLRVILTLRRDLGKSTGETLASRLTSLSNVLSKKVEAPQFRTASPPEKEEPEALLHQLVVKLQQNPRLAGAIATLLDLTKP